MKQIYEHQQDCCGCGVCQEICPVGAITMKVNSTGFIYPVVEQNKCINCKKCNKHCPMQYSEKREVIKVFAAICVDKKMKRKSASGGAFAAIANEFLQSGGIVCGAAVCTEKASVEVRHICIENIKELNLLQGSKYVQSNIIPVLNNVKEYLKQGREVLFSGTPCQVAALYSFLGNRPKNLTTIDLVCHGTPSPIWWNESMKLLAKKYKGVITEVSFRDSDCWEKGHVGYTVHIDKYGNSVKSVYDRSNPYYDLFLKSEISRECCYSCSFADKNRIADLTLGDFWGFSQEYNLEEIEKKNEIDLSHGLSCLIISSIKGEEIVNRSNMWLYAVDYSKVYNHNTQLKAPATKGKNREFILKLYSGLGYKYVDLYCCIKMRIWKLLHKLKYKG